MRRTPRLHLISDRRLCSLERLPAVARAAVEGGVEAVHLREKDLPADELLDVARALRIALGGDALLIVNGRLDVALLAAADGLQLPESNPPLEVSGESARDLLIGRSIHDVGGARRAAEAGADFLLAGHVYETRSHAGEGGRGAEFVREVAAAVSLRVIAIGGITPKRVPELLEAGAWGVAVLSGILGASDPALAAARYREMLGG